LNSQPSTATSGDQQGADEQVARQIGTGRAGARGLLQRDRGEGKRVHAWRPVRNGRANPPVARRAPPRRVTARAGCRESRHVRGLATPAAQAFARDARNRWCTPEPTEPCAPPRLPPPSPPDRPTGSATERALAAQLCDFLTLCLTHGELALEDGRPEELTAALAAILDGAGALAGRVAAERRAGGLYRALADQASRSQAAPPRSPVAE
jgi:hypothetical protein